MKRLLILLVLAGCETPNLPECERIKISDITPGIYSKPLGPVQIEAETCQIYETYQTWDCHEIAGDSMDAHPQCKGRTTHCEWKILTRITKCPSGNHVNGITKTNEKFPKEQVE